MVDFNASLARKHFYLACKILKGEGEGGGGEILKTITHIIINTLTTKYNIAVMYDISGRT